MDTSLLKKPNINDFNAFIEMKAKANTEQAKTLHQAAKQFEAIFLQRMLKGMRQANHFLSEDNPFRNKHAESFQEMLDQQRALDISSNNKGIGLADMIVKQLNPKDAALQHKSHGLKRQGINLPVTETIKELVSNFSERKSMVMTPKDFVQALWPAAQAFAKQLGLDPKMLIAQAIHETGWGKQMVKDAKGESSLNVFNIKGGRSWDKKEAMTLTTEYIDGKPIKMHEPFRQYDSIEESFQDYVDLIKNNNRYETALTNSDDPKAYMQHLQQAGYATDPNYASKVISIYEGDRFTKLMTDMESN